MGVANQKLFRFLLEKCHPPILKIKEKALVCAAALAAGGAAGWESINLLEQGSSFVQNLRPKTTWRFCGQDFPGSFPVPGDFFVQQAAVRRCGATRKMNVLYSDFSGAAVAALSSQFLIPRFGFGA